MDSDSERDRRDYDDSFDDDEDFAFITEEDSDDEVTVSSRKDKKFTILGKDDIQERVEEAIINTSTVLSVSREIAMILLSQFNWDVSAIQEEWFSDEEKVRKDCGLLENPIMVQLDEGKKFLCGICLEKYRKDRVVAASCGHRFCKTCWETYVRLSINEGRGCLRLRCPQYKCGAAVGRDIIDSLVCEDDKMKYENYVLRSYIEDRKKTKWCPAPGCNFAVEYDEIGSNSRSSLDVACNCSYSFCWNCLEEIHSPVDCKTLVNWALKNSSESENANWVLCNTKPCPRCQKAIEKNHGCMHMTCAEPCNFEFCWLCLDPWSKHGENTGGFYACNQYKKAKEEGKYDEDLEKKKRAKMFLDKYTHYYERWAANDSSKRKALLDLQEFQNVHIEKLCEIQAESKTMLKFILDAWLQIVECRRVLKWSYAYGYYIPEDELAKQEFFEYMQGVAEASLEILHSCVEKEVVQYLTTKGPSENFNDFRKKLVCLTSATGNHFATLVRALENGLSDLPSKSAYSKKISQKKIWDQALTSNRDFDAYDYEIESPDYSSWESSDFETM